MAIQYVPFNASGSMLLPPNHMMRPGQRLVSENGRFHLVLRSDGNLVLVEEGKTVWIAGSSQPYSRTLIRKKMRESTHFVVSNSGFLYDPSRKRLWIAESSHTLDKSKWYNSCMVLRDDGNLVIYDRRNGHPCWARFGFVPGRLPKQKPYKELFNFPIYEWNF